MTASALHAPPSATIATPSAKEDGDMYFGPFRITETQSFPPPAQGMCWTYLTLNAEVALSLPERPALQALLASARTRISIDGQWLWWALRRKYRHRPLAKLSGSDLVYDIAAHCANHGQRLLLLGASARANAAAVQALRRRWPALQVAGYAPPPYALDDASERHVQAETLAAIGSWQPQYVVLGLDNLKQHRLALQIAPQLDGRVHGLLCFGGAIDMAGGLVRRAPVSWQRLGLEGVYRVLQQPGRLWRFVRVLRVLPLLVRGAY